MVNLFALQPLRVDLAKFRANCLYVYKKVDISTLVMGDDRRIWELPDAPLYMNQDADSIDK